MKQEYLNTARALYKPTPKVEALVLKLCNLFDEPLSNGETITSISFDEKVLKISGLFVKKLIRGGQHRGIEVHWYPNHNISTQSDPFCSAFILRYNSLEKLYRETIKIISQL